MHDDQTGLLDDLTLDDIINVYMIILTKLDPKSGCFIPKFIEEKGVFESAEDAVACIFTELDNGPRRWYSAAPLMIPRGLESRELLDCVNFDTLIKEKFFTEKEEQEEEKTEEDGANIITIQDVWAPFGGMPEIEEEEDDEIT